MTSDDHLKAGPGWFARLKKAATPEGAFDLYASRYWALRKLFESDYRGPSPIADPDLHLVDPRQHKEHDAPPLNGHALPQHLLQSLYHDAAHNLIEPFYRFELDKT
jgi:hypothetical protein